MYDAASRGVPPAPRPLDRILAAERLRLEDVLASMVELCRVVQTLHATGAVHGDLRPGTIVWSRASGAIELLDRGGSESLAHLSPERTGRLDRSVDGRADLYSLGVVLYELLTGELPFNATDAMALIHCHIARAPTPPHERNPAVPRALSRIVLRLMAKDADDRYQSCAALRCDLEWCMRSLTEEGRIPDDLAIDDRPTRFRTTGKLYGRERECRLVRTAVERAGHTRPELLLVSGPSGVGKSVLVREAQRATVERGGVYVEGKCDQLKRDVPYAALREALGSAIKSALSGNEDDLVSLRFRIQRAIGDVGQLMVDLVPELEAVIGPQPAVEQLAPIEARARFQHIFDRFISVLAAEGPLTIFIDDLQWIDGPTLSLLQNILSDAERRGIVVAGAYRDGDVGPEHPLQLFLSGVPPAVRVHRLDLGPLSLDNVTELMTDALKSTPGELSALSRMVYTATEGNAFYTVQLLETLCEERALFRQCGRWTWDDEEVRRVGVQADVIDLMLYKLRRLPASAQNVLRIGACIGHTFTVGEVAAAARASEAHVAAALAPVSACGLVLVDDQRMQFLHDRVQQAAYLLIPEDERECVHLEIGRLLLASTGGGENDDRLFDIVTHLNHGRSLIRSADEHGRLVELNLAAARRARASIAYDALLAYTRVAEELLAEEAWETAPKLAAAVHLDLAEALYLNGRIDEVEPHLAEVLSRTDDTVTAIAAHRLRVNVAIARGNPREAAAIALDVMRGLGITIPEPIRDADIAKRFLQSKLRLTFYSRRRIERLPMIQDREILATLEFLMFSLPPLGAGNPAAFPLVILHILRLTLDHGHSVLSPVSFLGFAIILARIGRFTEARKYMDLAWALQHRFGSKKVKVYLAGGASLFLRWYWEPLRDIAHYSETAGYADAVEVGNLELAGHELHQVLMGRLFAGDPLPRVLERTTQTIEAVERMQQWSLLGALHCIARSVATLVGEQAALDQSRWSPPQEGNTMTMLAAVAYEGHADLVLGDGTRAREVVSELELVRDALPINMYLPVVAMVESLVILRVDGVTRSTRLDANRKSLRRWARMCPAFVAPKHLLVEAELARMSGKTKRADVLYERAARAALDGEAVHDAAFARELFAEHHDKQGRAGHAHEQRVLAHQLYRQWGAHAKVEALEARHSELRPTPRPSGESPVVGLDLESAWKASRALAGDIVLERLLRRLMEIMVENAGARAGALVLRRDDAWKVEARLHLDPVEDGAAAVSVLEGVALDDAAFLSRSIIQYVIRTGESVVLEDAEAEWTFADDQHAKGQRSVLAIPLVKRGAVTAVLYLENSLTKGAFTADRVELLTVLSGQATVSIENALLYESLERKVEERTRKLEELQAVAVENAHCAGMAEIATDVLHNVGNVLNGVNICCSSLGEALQGSRVGGLARAGALMREQGDRLPEFLADDPRGRMLLRYLPGIADELAEENRRALEEVGELQVRVQLINDVIAAQQSYATGGWLTESVDLAGVVDGALQLQAASLAKRTIHVDTTHAPVHPVAAQRTKLIHVLVNLLMNADEAMADVIETGRTLHVSTGIDPEGIPFVRVADTGHGIAGENLDRIFAHGFTTKQDGHGFGLHSCANSLTEMGGRLTVESGGLGKGAAFTLWFDASRSARAARPSGI